MVDVGTPIEPLRRFEHYFESREPIEPLPYIKDPERLAFRPEGRGYSGGLPTLAEPRGLNFDVDTRYFEPENHYIDYGIPISDDFAMTERIRLLDGGKTMEIAYTMTDPQMWDGEWKSTKRFTRQDYTDINESQCILQYNEHLPGTELGSETAQERGQSQLEGQTKP